MLTCLCISLKITLHFFFLFLNLQEKVPREPELLEGHITASTKLCRNGTNIAGQLENRQRVQAKQ